MPKTPRDYQRKSEPFTFMIGATEYALPTDLSVRKMAQLASAEANPTAMVATLEDVLEDEDLAAAVTGLPMGAFGDLMTDWLDAMGGSGNSEGSSES
jgi:hypothetical protein